MRTRNGTELNTGKGTTDMKWPTDECQEKLAEQVPALMQEEKIPGISLAFISDGEVSYRATFGVADAAHRTPAMVNTMFEAASLGKPVFAYAVLKLCESAVINLDTPLTEYLSTPYLADDANHRFITTRHVLSHTTGFPNWRGDKPLKPTLPQASDTRIQVRDSIFHPRMPVRTSGRAKRTRMWQWGTMVKEIRFRKR